MLPFASSFKIFINVFMYVKANSKEIDEEILFFIRKNADVSIFVEIQG